MKCPRGRGSAVERVCDLREPLGALPAVGSVAVSAVVTARGRTALPVSATIIEGRS